MQSAVNGAFKSGKVLRSAETMAELVEVVRRPKFDLYLRRSKREAFLIWIRAKTIPVLVKDPIAACRDPRDNKFLELAVAGKADIILSGDDDLLALDPFQDIRILSPTAFISD